MPRHDTRARARRWARELGAELCATALLVALGLAPLLGGAAPLAHVAGAFGAAVAGCCQAFGAHMNPALSLAAALRGHVCWRAGGARALAQLLGALLGAAALRAAGAPPALTLPAPGLAPLAAAALEAALTGLLSLACLALWAAPVEDPAAPLKLGLLVAGLVLSGGAATGASLNPARSLAPALLHWRWESQWVYWVGPLGGAALAALLHRLLTPGPADAGAEAEAEADAGAETVPLDDKV